MADRQTRVLGGNGSSVQAFTLDPGLLQYVQSVFVTVDNAAGSNTRPTLTVATNNGTALAKKQQGRSIVAGDTGSATWALGLAEEQEVSTVVGDYVFLLEDTLGVAGSINLAPLPATFSKLVIELQLRVVNAAGFSLRFNSDATDSYGFDETWLSANGGDFTNLRSLLPAGGTNEMGDVFSVTEDELTADAAIWSDVHIELPYYADTTRYKNVLFSGTGLSVNNPIGYLSGGGTWLNTAAIGSVQVFTASGTNLAAGSRARVYGVA